VRTSLIAVVLWFAAVAGGASIALHYANTPGPAGSALRVWPAGSGIERVSGHSVLLVFVHPECPCSRATLGELAILMAQIGPAGREKLTPYVVFSAPSAVSGVWSETELWKDAAAIPQVRIVRDRNGLEARNFRALTSGHTLLYGSDGRLLFAGGITASRGHVGWNEGLEVLTASIHDGSPRLRARPVFGCSLLGEEMR
jgi:hypothetical protein